MLIAFIGDVHGKVFHLLSLLVELQCAMGQKIDRFIQLGDLGAYPDASSFTVDVMNRLQHDETELHFSKLMKAGPQVLDSLARIKSYLGGPIYVVRGNHEDWDFLNERRESANSENFADLDPVGMFSLVADGYVCSENGVNIGFLGGIESNDAAESIDLEAVERLGQINKRLDVLVTHQNPYGCGRRFRGRTGGSHLMTGIVEALNPTYLFYGHTHRAAGPYRVMNTFALGVDGLMPLLRDTPEHDIIPGWIALLDTEDGIPCFAHCEWFMEYHRGMTIPDLMNRANTLIDGERPINR